MKIIDNTGLKLADADRIFIKCTAGVKKSAFMPGKALARYQFLEILLRIAIYKYFESKYS